MNVLAFVIDGKLSKRCECNNWAEFEKTQAIDHVGIQVSLLKCPHYTTSFAQQSRQSTPGIMKGSMPTNSTVG